MRNVPTRLLALLGSIGGCEGRPDAHGSAGTSTASAVTEIEATAVMSGSGVTGTSTTPTTGAQSSSDDTECGNGELDPGEACDDGNRRNGDGCNVDCQPSGVQAWEHRSGLAGFDAIYDVAVNTAGELMVCGSRSAPDTDRWVAKFDLQGGEIWSITYPSPGPEALLNLASTPAGAVVVGSLRSGDGHDIWVGGVDDVDGALRWQDTFSSGLGDDYATGAAAMAGGDVVVVGLEATDGGRTWLRRYTETGEPRWTSSYAGIQPLYSLGPGVAVHGEQIVISTMDQSAPPVLPELIFAVPSTGGAELWRRPLADTNGVLLSVATLGTDLVVAGRSDFKDLVVRRLSAAGDQVAWSSLACAGGNGRDIAVDAQGDIVVIGDGAGKVGVNVRLCKFSGDGKLLWGKDIDGGSGDDRGLSVRILESDQIVAAGFMADAQGTPDAWMALFSP